MRNGRLKLRERDGVLRRGLGHGEERCFLDRQRRENLMH